MPDLPNVRPAGHFVTTPEARVLMAGAVVGSDIGEAVSKVPVQGDRYSEHLQRLVDR